MSGPLGGSRGPGRPRPARGRETTLGAGLRSTRDGARALGLSVAAGYARSRPVGRLKKAVDGGDPGRREGNLTWVAVVLAVLLAFGSRAFRVGFSWDVYIDEVNYLQISQGVVRTMWVNGNEGPFYLHPPLFFFVEAAYIKVFGVAGNLIEQMQSVRYLVAAFAGLSAGALLWSGRLLAGWPAGICAAAIFVLDPFSNKVNGHNMLDTPALLWMLLGYGLLFSALVRKDGQPVSWSRATGAGLLFGLAILTKEVSVFVTLLPMGICFVLGWALPRTRSILAGTVAVAVYTLYPAAVYARGDWPLFVEKKFDGVSRLAGFVQFTGFNQEGGPSFVAALITKLYEYGTTYALMATGGAALAILLLTGLGRDPARRLLIAWTFSAYALLAYITVFGTLEDQFFYYLVVPSTLATGVTATLVLRETPVGAALRAPGNRRAWLFFRAAAVGLVGFVIIWNAHLWFVVHTIPDNGYQRVEAFVDELPESSRIAVTSQTAELLMQEHADGPAYTTVKGLRTDGVDYVIINEELVTEGWEEPPPEVYRWVEDEGRLAYGFESSRSSGLVGVWRLGDPGGSETAASGDATKAPVASPGGTSDVPFGRAARCEGDDYLCIRERVAEIAPEAEYLGGRIDVETGGPAPNRYVLFFEDPATETCEFRRLEQVSEGTHTYYVAVVAGKGSYGRDCVAEAGQ